MPLNLRGVFLRGKLRHGRFKALAKRRLREGHPLRDPRITPCPPPGGPRRRDPSII